jgi:hypothetical protein
MRLDTSWSHHYSARELAATGSHREEDEEKQKEGLQSGSENRKDTYTRNHDIADFTLLCTRNLKSGSDSAFEPGFRFGFQIRRANQI